jgi:hypothetical protein
LQWHFSWSRWIPRYTCHIRAALLTFDEIVLAVCALLTGIDLESDEIIGTVGKPSRGTQL